MKNQIKLKNPSITLYAFQIHHELGKEIDSDAHKLWENLSKLSEPLSVPDLKNFTKKLICCDENGKYNPDAEHGKNSDMLELIQPERFFDFKPVSQDNDLKLSGFIYPVRIKDTYAADLTLLYKDQEIEISQLKRLNPKGCLLPSNIKASLGQTLLLYAEPTDGAIPDQNLADKCINEFLNKSHLCTPHGNGKLFGSPVFEYENENDSWDISEHCHILVWLNTNPQTPELAEKGYNPLMHLLCCRNKISFAYSQSMQCNENARKIYIKLEKQAKMLSQLKSMSKEERIRQTEQLLADISSDALEFSRYIRDMEDFKSMIATNTENYAKALKAIQKLSQPEHEDDFKFLENFHTIDCLHFQQQIQTYLSYLIPGQNLFREITDNIRGRLEVDILKQLKENGEQDSRLQVRITFILFLFAGATISATINPRYSDADFFIYNYSMLFHFLVGALIGAVAIFLIDNYRKFCDSFRKMLNFLKKLS